MYDFADAAKLPKAIIIFNYMIQAMIKECINSYNYVPKIVYDR